MLRKEFAGTRRKGGVSWGSLLICRINTYHTRRLENGKDGNYVGGDSRRGGMASKSKIHGTYFGVSHAGMWACSICPSTNSRTPTSMVYSIILGIRMDIPI